MLFSDKGAHALVRLAETDCLRSVEQLTVSPFNFHAEALPFLREFVAAVPITLRKLNLFVRPLAGGHAHGPWSEVERFIEAQRPRLSIELDEINCLNGMALCKFETKIRKRIRIRIGVTSFLRTRKQEASPKSIQQSRFKSMFIHSKHHTQAEN